jgi:hypothetical protein
MDWIVRDEFVEIIWKGIGRQVSQATVGEEALGLQIADAVVVEGKSWCCGRTSAVISNPLIRQDLHNFSPIYTS